MPHPCDVNGKAVARPRDGPKAEMCFCEGSTFGYHPCSQTLRNRLPVLDCLLCAVQLGLCWAAAADAIDAS